MLFRTLVLILVTAFSTASAQSSRNDIMNLDPNIAAAMNCGGMLFAVSMRNFEDGVLTEERARVMTRTVVVALRLMVTRHQSLEHFRENVEAYNAFFNGSLGGTIDDLYDGNYTWDSQAETDKCMARIFDSLTSVTAEDLQRSGVQDYPQLVAELTVEADKQFDYILKLMQAMQ